VPVDRNDPERLLIRQQELAARPKPAQASHAWPPSEFVPTPGRATVREEEPQARLPSEVVSVPPRRRVVAGGTPPSNASAAAGAPSRNWKMPMQAVELTKWQEADTIPPAVPKGADRRVIRGRSIKIVVPLDPAEIVTVATPNGVPRLKLRADVAEHKLVVDVAAKSIRRAIGVIREHGADGVTCIIQGRLVGERIDDAGLSAQPKAQEPKAKPSAA